MDPGPDGVSDDRWSIYRVSTKLLSLQRRCHLDVVSIRHITAALGPVGGASLRADGGLTRQEVTRILGRIFCSVSQEVAGLVTEELPEKICRLVFGLFDRRHTCCVSAASLQTVLVTLSSQNLQEKYRALVRVAANESGSVSRSRLRSLLHDLNQVPVAVQEEETLVDLEAAVTSCFKGVLTPTLSEEHVLSWLQREPPLFPWLPTLYRLSIGHDVRHGVRCHACRTAPITGLRYRCVKCVNVHVCQSCFLTSRQTRKHRKTHPVMEFYTQPTWRESLSWFVRSTCHALLPWRYAQRQTNSGRILMWAEPAETPSRAPPPKQSSTRLAVSAAGRCDITDSDASCGASFSSRCQQPDEEEQVTGSSRHVAAAAAAAALLTDIRDLQIEKWLLEEQLRAWRLTVQSEHGLLEDRCSQMEVTMETLRKDNRCLQDLLTQAVNKMEARQHISNRPESVTMETENNTTPSSNSERNTDDEERTQGEQSPTMHQDTLPSLDGPEGAGPWEEEDCGTCRPEALLQDTMSRLKAAMETDRWTERQTGELKGAELREAAEQVGDSLHHLVEAVRHNKRLSRPLGATTFVGLRQESGGTSPR